MKLSVIVTVYNAAEYLPRFLELVSRAAARVTDSEVIFVDDCSSDDSVKIIKDYSVTHCLSFMIHHLSMNMGVSAARQIGLELAKGEYVIFADSDDWMDEGMYEELVRVADETKADVLFEDFFENDTRRGQKFDGSGEDLICAILGGRIHGATWNKLIRRAFIVKSGARFCEERLGLCEDVDFLCQLLVKDPKIRYVDACHYHYVNVASSATHKLSEQSFKDLERVAARLTKILLTEKTKAALLKWRKGNRLACFLQKHIRDEFFYGFAGDLRNLNGLPTNLMLKVLFWLGARGGRKWLLKFL